jgi:3-deoxy-D-manno-octulosonic-acid transferase
MPDCVIALSNTTDGGHDAAQALLKSGEVDALFFFPLDVPPAVRRTLNALRPDAILFMETELWPNLLHIAGRRGIETFLINGRVSDNLLKTAPRLGPVWKWMSGNMGHFLMRGEVDAERLTQLGVPDEKIAVTGDVKLEAPPVSTTELRATWRSRLGLQEDELLWLAGSTHPGEEAMLLQAYRELLPAWPPLRLAIAPRHIDRTSEVLDAVRQAGFEAVPRSSERPLEPNSVYVLDTVGELSDFYAAADLSFVGGSLIERGGHNMLEPVLRGSPVLFGPYVMNFRTAAELVSSTGLGQMVASAEELVPAANQWLWPASERAAFAARVEGALGQHRGAANRIAAQVARALGRNLPQTELSTEKPGQSPPGN